MHLLEYYALALNNMGFSAVLPVDYQHYCDAAINVVTALQNTMSNDMRTNTGHSLSIVRYSHYNARELTRPEAIVVDRGHNSAALAPHSPIRAY